MMHIDTSQGISRKLKSGFQYSNFRIRAVPIWGEFESVVTPLQYGRGGAQRTARAKQGAKCPMCQSIRLPKRTKQTPTALTRFASEH